MNERTASPKQRRRDWVIILIILLLGFLCVIIAGQWAIRFSPTWKLDTNMGSNLDPNSDFLTNRPVNYIEPLDPSILTQPVWVNVFLTPGALFDTRTPAPTVSAAPNTPSVATTTPVSTTPASTITVTATLPIATNTSIYVPPPTPTPTSVKSTDLRITKTDSSSTYTSYAGSNTVTYIVVVSNLGSGNATGALVSDPKPSQIANWSWACTSQLNGASGCNTMSGSSNFSDTVNLPSGSSIVYTVTSTITIGATGNLVNTAYVSVPSGMTDPNTSNNSATDTDTLLVPSADLAITKTDGAGVTTYTVGGTTTYTITVSNPSGPNNIVNATVTDTTLTTATNSNIASATWTCSGTGGGTCIANGSGNINDSTVDLPVGATVVYTVNVNISNTASGSLANTASVSVPTGYTDPNGLNNSATDTDTLFVPTSVDMQITKDDGVTTYNAGSTLTYTIVVFNNSPSTVNNVLVSDAKPTQITNWSWACTTLTNGASGCNTMSGSTNFTDTVNLPPNASITYTVTANISTSATGNLINTASVAVPVGYADPVSSNDSDTDTDTFVLSADLAITKTDGAGVTTYTVGGNVTYTITVSNLSGPNAVTDATVTDTFPAEISSATWTCSGSGGGACTASGTGDISDNTVDLPVGASVVYTVNATISPAATGNLVNTATVAIPVGMTDPTSGNNTDTDTDTPVRNVDLQITKDDGVTTYVPGSSVTYTITVSNAGPANVTGATVADTFPASITANWTCTASTGASCTASGSVSINDTVDIPVGGSLTYTVNASIAPATTGPLSNTATVAVPGGYTDTAPGNNSSMDTDTQGSSADLSITKTDNSTHYVAGATKIYTITVSNAGPSNVTGATVTDATLTTATNSNIASANWTCTGSGGATCTASGSGNIADTVNIPAGQSVTYTVTVIVVGTPSGNLTNTASVSPPSGTTDPVPGNNSASDLGTGAIIGDELIVSSNASYPNIGPSQDNVTQDLNAGDVVILTLSSPVVTGHANDDLIYYEQIAAPGIAMDWIILEIGDGSNWYTVLNWGVPNSGNIGTNINTPLPAPNPSSCSNEDDNCSIDASFLVGTPPTGITMDIDAMSWIPPGSYQYLRITVPTGGGDPGVALDGFEVP